MSRPVVDIGIATGKQQSPKWWVGVMGELMRTLERGEVEIGAILTVGSALSDHQRNGIADLFIKPANTAENRNNVVAEADGDYIYWIDDDTVPPPGVIEKLLRLDTDIAAGVYFRRNPPWCTSASPTACTRPCGTFRPARSCAPTAWAWAAL
jgi:hypothetical protein